VKSALEALFKLLRPDVFPRAVALLLTITVLLLALNPILAHFLR
jgi:hypothetical protein